jgi:hypothetical protein
MKNLSYFVYFLFVYLMVSCSPKSSGFYFPVNEIQDTPSYKGNTSVGTALNTYRDGRSQIYASFSPVKHLGIVANTFISKNQLTGGVFLGGYLPVEIKEKKKKKITGWIDFYTGASYGILDTRISERNKTFFEVDLGNRRLIGNHYKVITQLGYHLRKDKIGFDIQMKNSELIWQKFQFYYHHDFDFFNQNIFERIIEKPASFSELSGKLIFGNEFQIAIGANYITNNLYEEKILYNNFSIFTSLNIDLNKIKNLTRRKPPKK